MRGWLIGGISLPLSEMSDAFEDEIFRIAATEMKRAGVDPAWLHFRLYKKSIDARKKKDIRLVFSVAAYADGGVFVDEKRLRARGIVPLRDESVSPVKGSEPMQDRPLVVGMGPAGLFSALLLAEEGYRPILIDRGDSVKERVKCHERFVKEGMLDPESNIQFGAGGAGTFSDGKLVTRINDPKTAYVLQRLSEFGAPADILYSAKPHVGTDVLTGVVEGILSRIASLGGELRYRCRLDGISEEGGRVVAKTTTGDIPCSVLILAPGHSARDTYAYLMRNGYAVEPKPFSVGVRVEHLRADIDRALYGENAGNSYLGTGEYHLSDTKGERGVYTFCMCPGGEVVAAASEEGGVVVNGMSRHARNGVNSNSAVLVSIRQEDYGNTPEGAIAFQRRLEGTAFSMGGGDYCAPVETMGDFLDGRLCHEPRRILPTYREGRVRLSPLHEIFSAQVYEGLCRGFRSFDRKLAGFAASDAVLTGVETRTSSPVRLLRNEAFCAVGHDRVYPCGEGAGYAGGITSAAVDGLRVALAVIERFAPMG